LPGSVVIVSPLVGANVHDGIGIGLFIGDDFSK